MKLMRKNGWKFLLDIVMAVVLVLMYNKRVLGMAFHEIGGLAVCGLFIIHKLLNWKWIKAVTIGLFSHSTPVRQKLYWVLDFLLFGCFVYILVSGIMISKIVFPSTGGGGSFKMGHYAVAALALALTGIHVGLHMGWIGQRMAFLKKLPLFARRALAILLSVAVLAFGGMQFTSTSFVQWLGNIGVVFDSMQGMPEGFNAHNPTSDSGATSETSAVSTTGSDGTIILPAGTDNSAVLTSTASNPSSTEVANAQTSSNTQNSGSGLRVGQGPHGGSDEGESTGVTSVLLSFLSILFSFSVATAWVDGGFKAIRRRRLMKTARVGTPEA